MTIIGELLLTNLLGYLINLAAGERSAALAATRDAKLKDTLDKDETLRKALASTHSVREEIRGACLELARNRKRLGVPAHEVPLWLLLGDEVFQADLAESSVVSRKLTTGSKYDVQFSDLNAQYGFGFAAFDNAQVLGTWL